MSAQELADATAALGHPITRSQIANYESGRKHSLDVTELLVIAAALRVSPTLLLFPDALDRAVEVLPDQSMSTRDAIVWFSPGLIGPAARSAAELTEKLTQIGDAIAQMTTDASFASEGTLSFTVEAKYPSEKQETT
jgi:transcriptional regulator with XRE-family HTH domain